MTILQDILAALNWQTRVNENFRSVSPAGLYGINPATTTGLTLGYLGGEFNGITVANGTVSLTASNTNYVVAHKTTGVVTAATSTTNWSNTATYLQLYQLTAGASTFTIASTSDKRQAYGAGGSGGSASWGGIGGTLSSQTDLQSALDAKQSRAPSIQSVTTAGTVTPTFSNDMVKITAQAAGLTLANPTGTAIDGLGIVIRIKDNGTARSIAFGTQYRAIGVTLPTTTVLGKTLYLAMVFNNDDTKWDVVAVGQEA